MSSRRWALSALLVLNGCGDDGHVVGDMASGGSGGSASSSTSTPSVTNNAASTGAGVHDERERWKLWDHDEQREFDHGGHGWPARAIGPGVSS